MNTFKAIALFLGLAMSGSAFGIKNTKTVRAALEEVRCNKIEGATAKAAIRALSSEVERTEAQEFAEAFAEFSAHPELGSRSISPVLQRFIVKETHGSTAGKSFRPIHRN